MTTPPAFIDAVAAGAVAGVDQHLLPFRNSFVIQVGTPPVEALRKSLDEQRLRSREEPDLRLALEGLALELRTHTSKFQVVPEPCLREVNIAGGTTWDATAMSQTLQDVLEYKRAHRESSSASGPDNCTPSRAPRLTQQRQRRSGFIFPDLAMTLSCPCSDTECALLDCVASVEVKGFQTKNSHRVIMDRVKVAVGLWNARITAKRSLASALGPFRCSYMAAIKGAIAGMAKVNELAKPQLLATLEGFALPPSIEFEEGFDIAGTDQPPSLRWENHYPDGRSVETLAELVRRADADSKTKVALSQELAYSLSLVEVSNARHHGVVVGTSFTRVFVSSPQQVFIELEGWAHNGTEKAPASPVPIRKLLATVEHDHLAQQLMDDEGAMNLEALQAYLDLYARAVHLRVSTPPGEHLHKVPNSSPSTTGFTSVSPFAVERPDRLRVIATVAGRAGGAGARELPHPKTRSRRRHGPQENMSTPSDDSGSGWSQSISSLGLHFSGGALDITAEFTEDDVAAVSHANDALPLGADAHSYAADRVRAQHPSYSSVDPPADDWHSDGSHSDPCDPLPKPLPGEWREFMADLDRATQRARPDAVKSVLDDEAHAKCTLALFVEALELLETRGSRFFVVGPAEMERLLDAEAHRSAPLQE